MPCLCIYLHDSVYHELERAAHEKGMDIKTLARQLLEDYAFGRFADERCRRLKEEVETLRRMIGALEEIIRQLLLKKS